MARVKLRYTGSFQPKEIIEVEAEKVEGLLETGEYLLISDKPKKEKIEIKTEVKEDGELRRRP